MRSLYPYSYYFENVQLYVLGCSFIKSSLTDSYSMKWKYFKEMLGFKSLQVKAEESSEPRIQASICDETFLRKWLTTYYFGKKCIIDVRLGSKKSSESNEIFQRKFRRSNPSWLLQSVAFLVMTLIWRTIIAAEHGWLGKQFKSFLKLTFIIVPLTLQKQPPEVFYEKNKFTIFAGKNLCWSLFLIKLQVFRPATLLKRNPNTGIFLRILRHF